MYMYVYTYICIDTYVLYFERATKEYGFLGCVCIYIYIYIYIY